MRQQISNQIIISKQNKEWEDSIRLKIASF